MCAPDPWISVLPTFTDTGRLVRLENLDSDFFLVCTMILLVFGLSACVVVSLTIFWMVLHVSVCGVLLTIFWMVLHVSVCGVLWAVHIPLSRLCGCPCCCSVWPVHFWWAVLCSTGAATASFRVTVGVSFHTCVRSSSGRSNASFTTGCLALWSRRHCSAGTWANHSLSCMICCHGLAPVAVSYNRCRWLSHHTLGY